MAYSKKAKIWVIIFAIPLVLLVISIIGLKLYLTSERLKSLILPKIQESTHRIVTVQDISFSVFPSLAVSIDGLNISNPQGIKFDHDEFVSLDNIRLKVNILALIGGKLDINYIILNNPKIYLEASEENVNNYSLTLGDEKKEADRRNAGDKSLGALLVSNMEINNGEIEYINKKSKNRLIVKGLNQTMMAETKPSEQGIHIEGMTVIDKLSYGSLTSWFLIDQPFNGKTNLTYLLSSDVLKIDEITIKLKELPLAITGSVSKVRATEMLFDLSMVSPGMEMSQLLSLIPPEMLRTTKGISSSGDINFSVVIKGPMSDVITPSVQGLFTVNNGKIQYASLPKSIANINIKGTFEKPETRASEKGGGQFSIEKFGASLGNNQLTGKLSITNFDDPFLKASFNGSMNLGEVKHYYPLEQGTDLSGTTTADVTLDGKVKTPQNIKANGKIEFQNVTIKNANSPKPLNNLNGTITFNNQLIESKRLTMNVGESDMNIAFIMKNYLGLIFEEASKSGGIPSATITLTSKQLRTADLISEEKSQGPGTKKVNQKQSGVLPSFDMEATVSVSNLITEKFKFDNARGSVSVSKGIINLKNFSVNAFQGTIVTKGTLDLRDMKKRPFDFDLDIVGVQSNTILQKFTSFSNNIFGKLSMNTKLKGELNDTLGFDAKTLSGTGKVQIFDGKLLGFPLTTKLADCTGINELREVSFKNWTNAFSIVDGRINITDLKIGSSATDFLVNGSHGLDGSMAYNLTAKLPPSVSDRLKLQGVGGQLLQYFKDKDGRVNLNFDVGGTTTNPTLKLNTKAQEEMAKQQLLEQGKKKIGDELKNKAKEGLLKLFKKP